MVSNIMMGNVGHFHSGSIEKQTHKAATAQAFQNCLAGAVAAHSSKETIPYLYKDQLNFLFYIFLCLDKIVIEHLYNLIYVHIIHMLLSSSKPTSKNYQFCKIWFKVHHHLGSCGGKVKWVCSWRIQSMIYENIFYLYVCYMMCIL